jgi:hypothetical protein
MSTETAVKQELKKLMDNLIGLANQVNNIVDSVKSGKISRTSGHQTLSSLVNDLQSSMLGVSPMVAGIISPVLDFVLKAKMKIASKQDFS